MTCQFAIDGNCAVSSMMADVLVPLDGDVCRACREQDNPQGPNRVTCSRAIWMLKKEGKDASGDLIKCIKAPSYGAGTEFAWFVDKCRRMAGFVCLGWLFKPSEKCGCHAIKNEMNTIGTTRCKESLDIFAAKTAENYTKRFWVLRPAKALLVPVARYFLGRAIDRAEARLRNGGNR